MAIGNNARTYVDVIRKGIEVGAIDKEVGTAEIERLLRAEMAAPLGSAGSARSHSVSNPWPVDVENETHRHGMLCTRLRVAPAEFPFKKMATFIEGEDVYVVIITPNGPVTLTDEVGLFPSDRLITQLRLMMS